MSYKAQYLLMPAEGATQEELVERVNAFGQQVWSRLSSTPGSHVLISSLMDGTLLDKTLHSAMQGTPYPVVLEIAQGGADLSQTVELGAGLAQAIGSPLNAETSCALVGREYVFHPSEEGVRLIVPFTRPLSVSFEDCHSLWLNGHGWLLKPMLDATGTGYRQNHADPKASWLAAQAAGLGDHDKEGTAYGYFASVETYMEMLSDPEAAAAIHEDEKRFLDHSSTSAGLYETAALFA